MTTRPNTFRRVVRSAPGVVLLVVVTCALLPARLGGRAMFVVVQGNSMEPSYHSGDLLYSWRTTSFHLGDAAVYRLPVGSPGAGHLIVHRLVRELPGEPTRWVVKGENRSTPDDTQPTTSDLVARPLLNLGPFATRVMLLVPLFLTGGAAWWVGWSLWPRLRREFVWTLPSAPCDDFSWWVDEGLVYGPPRPAPISRSLADRAWPPPDTVLRTAASDAAAA